MHDLLNPFYFQGVAGIPGASAKRIKWRIVKLEIETRYVSIKILKNSLQDSHGISIVEGMRTKSSAYAVDAASRATRH